MKRSKSLFFLFILFISACGNNAALDQDAATDIVTDYLKSNPIYETERITLGEVKFRSKSDKIELDKFKDLQAKGFVDLQLQAQKKKFLSKDSTYVYLITLTDRSKPYILEQEQNKATLKVVEYVLDEGKPVRLDKAGNKTAKVTVMLKKIKNAFSVFYQDKNNGSNFMTKTYKMKYKKETGWKISGE